MTGLPIGGAGCGDSTDNKDEVTAVVVAPLEATIGVGATQVFKAQGVTGNGLVDLADATWASDNTAVATITGGTATGVAVGTAKITAAYNGLTSNAATLTVKERKLISIVVTPPSKTIAVGTTQAFVATANYEDGTNEVVTDKATWTSSDPTVATVDKGTATALKNGFTNIKAEWNSMSDEAGLTVGANITKIDVTPADASIPVTGKQQYVAMATLEGGSQQNVTNDVTWASDTTTVATIDATGLATGVAVGTTNITATLGTVKGTTKLTVTEKTVTKVEVSPTSGSIGIGAKTSFTAEAIFSDGSKQTVTTTATWASSDPTVATVDTKGEVTGLKAGTTQITATYLTVKSSNVPVTVIPAVIASITVTPAKDTVAVGMTKQYTAMATMSDGTQQNITSSANWQSSVAATATIDAAGLATGKATGTTEISATKDGVTGKTDLTVTGVIPKSITISPSSDQTMPKGITQEFTAEATMSDNTVTNVTTQCTWNSSTAGILSFTDNVAKALLEGDTEVTCTLPAYATVKSNVVKVKVTAVSLVSIAIDNPPTKAIPVGANYAFTATGTYSDQSKKNVTADATWASSDATKATISNAVGAQGIATAVAGGDTNITARIGTITSQTVKLTVATNAQLSYIVVTPADANLVVGGSKQYNAIGYYSDGSNFDVTQTALWFAVDCATLNPVANFTVDKGNVTAVSHTATMCESTAGAKNGYARVMARIGTVQSLAKVHIKNTTITKINVTCKTSASSVTAGYDALTCLPSNMGYVATCTALAETADGTTGIDITDTASWNSTNTAVATAAKGGMVTIVGAGTAVITATQGGVTSPTTGALAVPATVMGEAMTLIQSGGFYILVLPFPDNIMRKGMTQQYGAIALFSSSNSACDGQIRDVTRVVNWGSANTNVATVGNTAATKGLVTAVAKGTSNISAVYGTMTSPYSMLEVTDACIESVAFSARNPTYPADVNARLVVYATMSDKTTVRLLPVTDFTTLGHSPYFGAVTVPASCTNGRPYGPGYLLNQDSWDLRVGNADCTGITFSTTAGVCPTVAGGVVTATADITVNTTQAVTALTLEPNTATMALGTSRDFFLTATFGTLGSFNVSDTYITSWSRNPVLGTTLGNSPLTAAQYPGRRLGSGTTAGSTTLTGTYGTKFATAAVSISGRTVTGVSTPTITGGTACTTGGLTGFPVGWTGGLQATVTYSDGLTETRSDITFTSSNAAKAEVTASGAIIMKAPSAGTNPTITASYQGVSSAPLTVVIHPTTVVLTGMTFNPTDNATLNLNTTTPLTIMGVYGSCGSFDISSQVISATSNNSILDVTTDAGGTRLISKGTATGANAVQLTFIKDAKTFYSHYYVGNATCYASVTIEPAAQNVPIGTQQYYVAKATDTKSVVTDITTLGSWDTSDHSKVNPAGFVTNKAAFNGIATGTVTVSFSYSNAGAVCQGGDVTKHTITANATATGTPAIVDNVTVAPSPSRYIPLGEKAQLTANAHYTDGNWVEITSVSGATWTSTNTGVATVSAAGLVNAVTSGDADITVTYAGKSATVHVYVRDCGLPTMAVSSTATGSLPVGYTRNLTATATYSNAAPCNSFNAGELQYDVSSTATWASSATGVATVNTSGVATAVTAGTTNITATYRTRTSPNYVLNTVTVTLTALTVTQPFSTISVGQGGAMEITVNATFTSGGTTYTNIDPPVVNWDISDNSVISITGPVAGTNNHTYVVTGLKTGAGITYRARVNLVNSTPLTVNVTAACITAINLTYPSGNVVFPAGLPFQLTYACTSSENKTVACSPDFSYANVVGSTLFHNFFGNYATTGRARVSPTATAGHSADFTATISVANGACNGVAKSSTRRITVGSATYSKLTLPATFKMSKGTTDTLPATAEYTGAAGTGAGTYNVSLASVYTSNNGAVVGTQPRGGLLTAYHIDGTALVTASYEGLTSNNSTVEVSGRTLTGITIASERNYKGTLQAGDDAQMPGPGYSYQLTATGHYSSGDDADITDQVTWSLEAPVLADTAISAGGLLTTGTPTTAQPTQVVKAALGSVSDTFVVRIMSGAITTIAIRSTTDTSPSTTVAKGLTVPYEAQITIMGNTTAYWSTRNVTWASSNTAAGTISATGSTAGQFTALVKGLTNISANKGSVSSGPLAVTVTDAQPVSVFCSPATVNMVAGASAKLRATVRLSDGTTNQVADASWHLYTTTTGTAVAGQGHFDADQVTNNGLLWADGSTGTGKVYAAPTHSGFTASGTDRCAVTITP